MADYISIRRRRALKLLAALAAARYPVVALARYPDRAVRLIVPGGAGASTDAVARIVQLHAQEALGQSLIVDNRAGAGGVVGTLEAVRSPPDGYTLLVASLGTHVLRQLLVSDTGFDTLRDLSPITKLVDVPGIILAAPDLPVRNLGELIALARASSRPLAYGTPGIGTSAHLIAELLCARTGIKLLQVPYSNSPRSYADLTAGRIPLAFSLVTGVQGQVMSGRMKAIAVTSARRVRSLPQVPTVEESGIRDFDVTSWYGVMAPAGTPAPVLERAHKAFARTLHLADVEDRLANIGASAVGNTPAAFKAQIEADFKRWAAVIRDANIHL
ncbi:MAG TPA: tripartite tricarboxylate transporter substrate binding protein [Casimicrobiaceae bacterium]|jgi:tripartite-type tricarboxylate transporter receptor subunit TctC